ncbi:M20/M25/M40 family metallo-hydrolase [Actinomadura vinacea]|uniref:Vacuolar membrane protease n=1 Tax=Actinomadura vinacea TaxID=115336 RepID=A0ABN3JB39_9ACTN
MGLHLGKRVDEGTGHSRGRALWPVPAVLLALIALAVLDARPPRPAPAHAPRTEFSAARAHEQVRAISAEPHPSGTAANERVRDHVVRRLARLGLRPEVRRGVGRLQVSGQPLTGAAQVDNIVATIPGTDPTGRVILAAHYDSAAASPGAADDGAGVATLLETARVWQETARRPRNDLVFLFTDAEEPGLYGAEAFVHQDRYPGKPTVVLNQEARGSGGAALMFRTSPGNAGLVEAFAGVPHPAGDSSTGALFSLLPNDTDLSSFTRGGFKGMDTALVGAGAHYHSALDNAENLDLPSLQQMGANATALSQSLARTDLADLNSRSDAVYFPIPGLLVRYPAAWEPVLALGALGLTVLWAVLARRRRLLTMPALAGATAGGLVPMIGSVAAGLGLWAAVAAIRPADAASAVGEPYRPAWLLGAVLALAIAINGGWYALVRRRLGVAAAAVGGAGLTALIAVPLAFTLPGLSYLFTLPALGAAAAGVAVTLTDRTAVRAAALTVGLAPAAVLWGGGIASAFPTGGVSETVPLIALMLSLAALVAAPLLDTGARRTPLAATVLTCALVAGHFTTGFDARRPTQTMLAYALDADRQTATWFAPAQHPLAPGAPRPTDDLLPWRGNERMRTGPARPAALRPPTAAVLDDSRTPDGTRVLRLRLNSVRGAPTIGLFVDAATTVRSARVGNRDMLLNKREGRWDLRLQVINPGKAGVEVTLRLQGSGRLRFRLTDLSYDLRAVPGYRPPPSTTINRYPELSVSRDYTV